MILLGTNIRITIIINNKPPAVLARFQQYRLPGVAALQKQVIAPMLSR